MLISLNSVQLRRPRAEELDARRIVVLATDDLDVRDRVRCVRLLHGGFELTIGLHLGGKPILAPERRRQRMVVPRRQIVVDPIRVILQGPFDAETFIVEFCKRLYMQYISLCSCLVTCLASRLNNIYKFSLTCNTLIDCTKFSSTYTNSMR